MSGDTILLSDCTMRTISDLHQELIQRLSGAGPVPVDRSGVQRPSTALLQLLVAFVRDLRSQSRSVEWRGEGAAFDRAATSLGLCASLGLPVDT